MHATLFRFLFAKNVENLFFFFHFTTMRYFELIYHIKLLEV